MASHITATAATHDGRILTASQDNTLRVWALNDVARKSLKAASPLGSFSPSLAAVLAGDKDTGHHGVPGILAVARAVRQPAKPTKQQEVHGRIIRPDSSELHQPASSGATSDVGLLQPTVAPSSSHVMPHVPSCAVRSSSASLTRLT